jgi:predicted ATPase/DNA-binding XRE family transcriptional regulator
LIAVLREAAGLTQEEAAKRAGMSVRGLSNLERGLVGRPRRASLDALAEALELTDRDRRRLYDRYRPARPAGAEAAVSWRGPRSHLRELVGRDAELAELATALAAHDLVTVTGPGGCGKTALALAAAAAARRPVTVLALASLAKPEQLEPALATTLQVSSTDAGPEAIERALSGGFQLLLIDNAEHLAGAVGELVIRLRGGCPGLTMLITSREPLGVSEELVWRLLPLRTPADETDGAAPAAVLFRRRIREALPSADLSDAGAVARVCRRLDGLPLALELAAARVRALPVPQLADRLDRDHVVLDLLTSAVPGPNGRRTLEDTIDWSYRLLDAEEQRALAQLSVFRGRFTPEAVEAVVTVRGNPVAIAAQLIDRSLLQAGPAGGYAMLSTIRDYATQRLAASGELAATQGRHLDHWLDRGRRLDAIESFGDRLAAARTLSGDLADAEHAMAGGVEADRCVEVLQLAHMLLDCWNVVPGYVANGERWLGLVDRVGDRCPARLRALVRTNRGQLLSLLGDKAGGHAQLRAALADADALNPEERLDILVMLALVESRTLDPAAFGRAGQLLAASTSCSGDELAAALSTIVDIELLYGRPEQAAPVTERVGELVGTSCAWLAGSYHGQCAELAALRGDESTARAAVAAALATAGDLSTARRMRLRVAIAEVLLALDAPEETIEHVTVQLAELAGTVPEMRPKAPMLRVPMAEAMRRLGRPGAEAALRAGMEAALADRQLILGLAGVLVAAAVRQDAGDAAGAAELARDWQRVRTRLGLPVPAAYRRTAADLGLDQVAPDPSRARPAGPELDAVLARAVRSVSACAAPAGRAGAART